MKQRLLCLSVVLLFINTTLAASLPTGFVYLRQIDPSISQDMRYFSDHNFIGHPIAGYHANECILTTAAAKALKSAQQALKASGYALRVYDCYRPQQAVNEFVSWSGHSNDNKMKATFYPRLPKDTLFTQGYIAKKSGHSRGSTVDLTLVPLPTAPADNSAFLPQRACYAPLPKRFHDGSLDMGTAFDCFDKTAHVYSPLISQAALQNRLLLRKLMLQQGFKPYAKEWWHFTLKNEPFRKTYFDFPINPLPLNEQ